MRRQSQVALIWACVNAALLRWVVASNPNLPERLSPTWLLAFVPALLVIFDRALTPWLRFGIMERFASDYDRPDQPLVLAVVGFVASFILSAACLMRFTSG